MNHPNGEPFGREYLQKRISGEFPLARHLDVAVEAADDSAVILHAPLGPNANDKGSAFGGSLYSVAVLAGWAWTTRYLAARGSPAEVVIQESSMRFVAPCAEELRAHAAAPPAQHVDKLVRMLQRAGRGRIRLRIVIGHGASLFASFEGLYAAAARP